MSSFKFGGFTCWWQFGCTHTNCKFLFKNNCLLNASGSSLSFVQPIRLVILPVIISNIVHLIQTYSTSFAINSKSRVFWCDNLFRSDNSEQMIRIVWIFSLNSVGGNHLPQSINKNNKWKHFYLFIGCNSLSFNIICHCSQLSRKGGGTRMKKIGNDRKRITSIALLRWILWKMLIEIVN